MKMKLIHAILAALFAVSSSGTAAPYVVLNDNRRIDCINITGAPGGDITILDTANQRQTFPRRSLKEVYVDPPPQLKDIQKLPVDQALAVYQEVYRKYIGLNYDTICGDNAIQILLQQKKVNDARVIADTVIKNNPLATRLDPAFQAAYWRVLVASNEEERVKPLLDAAMREGSRAEAAWAQLILGEIKSKAGDHKGAVLDYLRAGEFYKMEQAVASEALYKAAETFEKNLKESPRAKLFYEAAAADFPGTRYGAMAAQKIK